MEVMLSDNTKRLLCRAGFVLFCALPTLLCLNAVLFPKSHAGWSAEFQQQFGVINQIGQVQVLSPRRTDFRDVLIGPDRFRSRLDIDVASLQSLSDGRVLFIENARGSADAFWQSIQRIVETVAWSNRKDDPVRLHFDSMTFLEDQSPESRTCVWRDLHIAIEQSGDLISASFVPDATTTKFVFGQSVATLECKTTGPERKWTFDTTGFSVPGWVMQAMVPAAAGLNPGCILADVQGLFNQNRDLWTGEIRSGMFSNIDLQFVVGQRFGTLIDGRLMLNVAAARIVNNRIQFLDGDLHCPSGTIGSQLLHASNRALGMQVVEPYGKGDREVFSNLRMGFKLENDEIAFYTMESGAVLNDAAGNRMLIAAHGQNWPVSSLVKLVSWPMQRVNSNSAALARHLMISPVELGSSEERTAQHDEVGDGSFFNR